MKCKFCDAEMEENMTVCPACGKEISAEPEDNAAQQSEEVAEEETAPESEDVADEEAVQLQEEGMDKEASEQLQETEPDPKEKKKTKPWKLVLLGLVGLVLVAAGLLLLRYDALSSRENNAMYKDSYLAEDAQIESRADVVVATFGDQELTVGQLQIYYWQQIYGFLNSYGAYYFDTSKPLSEQVFSQEDGMTWEQYFLDSALQSWQRYEAIMMLAKDAGYELSAEYQEMLDATPANLEAMLGTEFESIEQMLGQEVSPGCTLESYMDYLTTYYTSLGYIEALYQEIEPDDQALEAFFAEHEAEFQAGGVTRESGMLADVRHILVAIKGGTTDESGKTTYSQQDWDDCLASAEKILQEWKDGEATEESFIKLVGTYTEDSGSQTTGGLYTGITSTSSFVPNFRAWAVDETRKAGDTGIVESEFGYHIMYYVGGEPLWMNVARTKYLSTEASQRIEERLKQGVEIDYSKILLCHIDLLG